jgi:PGF-pre-PGF domain-containing protein
MTRNTPPQSQYRLSKLSVLFLVLIITVAPLAVLSLPVSASAGNTQQIVTADKPQGVTSKASTPTKTGDPQTHSKIGPIVDDIAAEQSSSGGAKASSTDSSSSVHIAVDTEQSQTGQVAKTIAQYGIVDARIDGRITGTVPADTLTEIANSSAVNRVEQPMTGTSLDSSNTGGEDEINATKLHKYSDDDFSGDGATVAVLDLKDFDKNNDIYSNQVINRINTGHGGPSSHATETAEVVAETAPKANLILVSIDSYTDLINRIDYLRTETETDVISISIGYVNTGPLDGTAKVDTEIQEFANDGGIFVPAMGNQANGDHWYGTYNDPDDDSYMEVGDGSHLIDIPDLNSDAKVYLQWDDYDTLDTSDEDYALQVVNGDTKAKIRESDWNQGGAGTNPPEEGVWVRTDDTNPKIRIEYNSGDKDAQFYLRSFDTTFTPSSKEGSILIPAASPDGLSVGAYGNAGVDWTAESVQAYSSRGPTSDGRTKPDIVAPDGIDIDGGSLHYGTSYAAPHAAGIATIAKAENPDLSTSTFISKAENTATSVQDDEPNNAAGEGLINGTGILSQVEEKQPTINSYTVTDAEDTDGLVSSGDTVEFSATVTDRFPDTVNVDASTYDMGTVQLTDGNDDGTYTYSGTVGSNPTNGGSKTTLTATDKASNSATASASNVEIDNKVTSISVTNSPLNPSTDSIQISGTADTTDTITFKVIDSEGESDTVSKSITNTDFSVEIDPSSLSLTSGNGKLDEGSITVKSEQASSFTTSEKETTFTADHTDPTVSINSPTDLTVQSKDTVGITYTASDDNGIKSADVSLTDQDGNTISSTTDTAVSDGQSTTTSLSIPASANQETLDITVTPKDTADNTKQGTVNNAVTVDDYVKSISIPTSGPIKPSESLTVTGSATSKNDITFKLTDGGGDIGEVTKTISNTDFSVSVTPDTLSYSGGNGKLDDGTVDVTAIQGTATQPVPETSIGIDGSIPTISVSSPSSQVRRSSGESQDITFTVSDSAGFGVRDATVELGSSPLDSSTIGMADGQSNTATVTVPSTASDGTYDITITADDAADNTQTKTLTDRVKIDNKVQTVSTTTSFTNGPLSVTGKTDGTTDISFTITDSEGTSDTITKSIASSNYAVSLPISDSLTEGSLTIDAKQGTSSDGAEATLTGINLDQTQPSLTIDSVSTPTDPATSRQTVSVTYTATDTNGHGITKGTISLTTDAGNVETTTIDSDATSGDTETAKLVIPTTTTDGTYDIDVTAKDKATNTNTKTNADGVTIENTVNDLSLTRSTAIFNETATVRIAGTIDTTTGVKYKVSQSGNSDTLESQISNTDFSDGIDLNSISFTPTEGSLSIKAKEQAVNGGSGGGSSTTLGFGSEESISTTIDTTPPTVTVGNVDTTAVTSGDDITTTYTSDDTNDHGLRGGVVQLVRNADQTVVTKQSVNSLTDEKQTSTTLTVPNTENGEYTVRVLSNDTAYNTGTGNSESITISNTVPQTSATNPSSGIVSETGSLTLEGKTDATGDLTFEFTDGSDTATATKTVSSNDYTTTIDLSTLSPSGGDGAFKTGETVTIKSDYGSKYANTDSSTTVQIDNISPTASISGPTSTTVTAGSSVDVTFKVTDSGPAKPDSATVKLVNSGSTLNSNTVNQISESKSTTTTISIPSDASAKTYDIVVETADTAKNTDPKGDTQPNAVTVEAASEDNNSGSDDSSGGGSAGGGGGGGGGFPAPAPEPEPAPSTPEEKQTPNSKSDSTQNNTQDSEKSADNTPENGGFDDPTTGRVDITQENKSTVKSVISFGTDNRSDTSEPNPKNKTSAEIGTVSEDQEAQTDSEQQNIEREQGVEDEESATPREVRATIEANAESSDGSIIADSMTINANTDKQQYRASVSALSNITSALNDTQEVSTSTPSTSVQETESDKETKDTPTDTDSTDTAIKSGGIPSDKTVGAIEVGHSISNKEVETASFTVGVETEKLERKNMSTDDITLYRYHSGEWTRVHTQHIGSNGSTELFEATSPGLSVFAIGSEDGTDGTIDSVNINQTQVFENDNIAINATVENSSPKEITQIVTFNVSGKTTNKSITVPSGESSRITHTISIDNNVENVNKDVYVNGIFAGTIEVAPLSSTSGMVDITPSTPSTPREPTDDQAIATTSTPQNTTEEEQTTGGNGPGFTIGNILAALLLLLLPIRQMTNP